MQERWGDDAGSNTKNTAEVRRAILIDAEQDTHGPARLDILRWAVPRCTEERCGSHGQNLTGLTMRPGRQPQ